MARGSGLARDPEDAAWHATPTKWPEEVAWHVFSLIFSHVSSAWHVSSPGEGYSLRARYDRSGTLTCPDFPELSVPLLPIFADS